MITFNEYQKSGYPARTFANIMRSDITIAFAENYNTAGEIYTRKVCEQNGKTYIQYPLCGNDLHFARLAELSRVIMLNKSRSMFSGFIINVAGNGIYSLKNDQSYYNNLFKDIWHFINVGGLLSDVKFISGGQTGIDQAGIIGANREGLDCNILAPKKWMFRNEFGEDVKDEKLFKERFI